MRKKLIPDVPESLVISEELEQKLQGWIESFKRMSPRIIVKTPQDKDFDLSMYEDGCKLSLDYSDNPADIVLCDWPKLKQIAFIISYDSATPGNKPQFLVEDAVVFCFNNFAFSLGHNSFAQGDRTSIVDEKYAMEYYLYGEANLLTWKFNRKLIKNRLLDLQKSIPSIPVE